MDTLVDIAKFVREAFGIQSSGAFIAVSVCFWGTLGSIWGGVLGYVVDKRYIKAQSERAANGPGGAGGSAKVVGDRSGATGGAGGIGGVGPGGKGGDAEVLGNDSYARGGDGGNSAQPDGRGGPRSISAAERENAPTEMWKYGYGGRGANAPEYDRRIKVLTQIRTEYFKSFPDDQQFIDAGVDQVPIHWVNKRLEELNESWRVEEKNGRYVLPPLKRN